jgi:hypothetical protein
MGFQFPFSLLGVRSLSYPEEALRLDCRDEKSFQHSPEPQAGQALPRKNRSAYSINMTVTFHSLIGQVFTKKQHFADEKPMGYKRNFHQYAFIVFIIEYRY